MPSGLAPAGTTPAGLGGQMFHASFDLNAIFGGSTIINVVSLFDRELINRLAQSPNSLRILDRRAFELLVAELFTGFGYEVELTKRTRDGGRDIVAIRRKEVETRFLIECKRRDPGNPIGVSTVRELYGVKVDDRASKAILATTTRLTRDARLFVERHRWELEARDFDAIHEWINDYLRRK